MASGTMTEHEAKAAEIAHKWDSDYRGQDGGIAFLRLIDAIAAALDEVVKAEKQRCANVADAYGIVVCTADQVSPKVVTGRTIAKAILSRGEK